MPRSPHPRISWRLVCALSIALFAGASRLPVAAQADPFASGERWAFDAPAALPWIPRSLTFTGAGEFVWVGRSGSHPGFALHAAGELEAPDAALLVSDLPQAAFGVVQVAAARDAVALYGLWQEAWPDVLRRRTRVVRMDPAAPGFTPAWTFDPGLLTNGTALVACSGDGAGLYVAVFDDLVREVRIDRLEPATGAVLWTQRLGANGLRRLVVSEDGARVAVGAGSWLWLLDGADGANLLNEIRLGALEGLALDAAGTTLAVSEFESTSIYVDDGTGYTKVHELADPNGEWVLRTALDATGATLALLSWDPVSGSGIGVRVYDTANWQLLNEEQQRGGVSSLQNYPVELRVSDDGARIAAAFWGTGDGRPEVLLLERGQPGARLEPNLAGSPYALDLDRGGTRLAVGTKDLHANLFATDGTVRLFDTGERELQWIGPTRPGGTLELRLAAPGATAALFLMGFPRPTPLIFGSLGELWLEPARGHIVRPAALVGARAACTVGIAPDLSLVGLPLIAQALTWAGAWQLVPSLARPVVY